MSETRDNGGPAFQIRQVDGVHPTEPGMSLRDYFAAHALASLESHNFECFAHMAAEAYSLADAMLAASKGTSQ